MGLSAGVRVAGVVVLVLGGAACSTAATDPCDGQSPLCLGLRVEGAVGDLDALSFILRGPAGLRASQPVPPHAPFSLPIEIGLLLPPDTAGALSVVVVGQRKGMDVASGGAAATVPPDHQLITVTLTDGADNAPFPANNDAACAVATGSVDVTTASCAGRISPDAPAVAVAANVPAGARSVTLGADPVGLTAGDELLIVDLQGTAAASDSVGSYETAFVIAIDGRVLTLFHPLKNSYDGTTQKILVQRLPRYASLHVAAGATLTADGWDGMRGGVFAARALGAANLEGAIDMSGKGYRGGKVGSAQVPESFSGWLVPVAANGLDGTDAIGGDGGGTGTGGGTGHDSWAGDKGGVGHGGGGGGGRGFYQNAGWVGYASGGGGGAFPSADASAAMTSTTRLLLGSGGTQGAGGGGGGGYFSGQTGGGGGHSDGGGGASGKSTYSMAAIGDPGGSGSDGSSGGGAIALWAASLTAGPNAFITDGGPGGAGGAGGKAGGGVGAAGGGEGGQGAAGGSVVLRAPTLMLASNAVHASGGAGGKGGDGNGQPAATGGTGALFVAGDDPGMGGMAGSYNNTCGGPPGGCSVPGGGGGRGGRSGFAGRVSQGAN